MLKLALMRMLYTQSSFVSSSQLLDVEQSLWQLAWTERLEFCASES